MAILPRPDVPNWDEIPRPQSVLEINSHPTDTRISSGSVRTGVDSEDKRHLLVPVGRDTEVPVDKRSRAVVLVTQELEIEDSVTRFADLVCVDPRLEEVFGLLCADVLRRVGVGETDPVVGITHALGEWRDLLRYAEGGPKQSTVIGLVGELEILQRCAEMSPVGALEAWRGPRAEPHDFRRGGIALEVKASLARNGSRTEIHGLDQLDPPTGTDLHIAFLALAEEANGQSVQERVDYLLDLGLPADQLLRLLENLGYEHGSSEHWDTPYRVERLTIWQVDAAFPGIRRSDLHHDRTRGLDNLAYTLDLDAAGPPLSISETVGILQRLADAA